MKARIGGLATALGVLLGSATLPVRAADAPRKVAPALAVSVSCEHRQSKGRVLCDVEIETKTGRITWADVLVVEAPAFAPPLRSRVQMGDARTRTDQRIRIPIAFVATSQGKGTVTLRARTVLCLPTEAIETCVPRTQDAQADLVVGTDVVQ